MTWRKQINGEVVPNEEKIFSIYEQHTDIIVNGQREVQFGHKINLTNGKSSLILSCEVLEGNPADRGLYQKTIDKIVNDYHSIAPSIAQTRLQIKSLSSLNSYFLCEAAGYPPVDFSNFISLIYDTETARFYI